MDDFEERVLLVQQIKLNILIKGYTVSTISTVPHLFQDLFLSIRRNIIVDFWSCDGHTGAHLVPVQLGVVHTAENSAA